MHVGWTGTPAAVQHTPAASLGWGVGASVRLGDALGFADGLALGPADGRCAVGASVTHSSVLHARVVRSTKPLQLLRLARVPRCSPPPQTVSHGPQSQGSQHGSSGHTALSVHPRTSTPFGTAVPLAQQCPLWALLRV